MKPKRGHYYKYHTENIHIIFRLLSHDILSQKIKVIRVYRTTVETSNTIGFIAGESYETLSMFWDSRLNCLKEVPRKLGKRIEKGEVDGRE